MSETSAGVGQVYRDIQTRGETDDLLEILKSNNLIVPQHLITPILTFEREMSAIVASVHLS